VPPNDPDPLCIGFWLLFITVRAFVGGLSDLAGMTVEVIMYQTIREYKTNLQSVGEILAATILWSPFHRDAGS